MKREINLSPEQVKAILVQAKETSLRDHLLLRTMTVGDFRVGEVVGSATRRVEQMTRLYAKRAGMMKHCPWEHDLGGCPIPCFCRWDDYCVNGKFHMFRKRHYPKKNKNSRIHSWTYPLWIVYEAVDQRNRS